MRINESLLNETISIDVKKTTPIVENIAIEFGKSINKVIKKRLRYSGMNLHILEIDGLFWRPIKSKQPDDISQNREGIKK